jgi:hypothetical protein
VGAVGGTGGLAPGGNGAPSGDIFCAGGGESADCVE